MGDQIDCLQSTRTFLTKLRPYYDGKIYSKSQQVSAGITIEQLSKNIQYLFLIKDQINKLKETRGGYKIIIDDKTITQITPVLKFYQRMKIFVFQYMTINQIKVETQKSFWWRVQTVISHMYELIEKKKKQLCNCLVKEGTLYASLHSQPIEMIQSGLNLLRQGKIDDFKNNFINEDQRFYSYSKTSKLPVTILKHLFEQFNKLNTLKTRMKNLTNYTYQQQYISNVCSKYLDRIQENLLSDDKIQTLRNTLNLVMKRKQQQIYNTTFYRYEIKGFSQYFVSSFISPLINQFAKMQQSLTKLIDLTGLQKKKIYLTNSTFSLWLQQAVVCLQKKQNNRNIQKNTKQQKRFGVSNSNNQGHRLDAKTISQISKHIKNRALLYRERGICQYRDKQFDGRFPYGYIIYDERDERKVEQQVFEKCQMKTSQEVAIKIRQQLNCEIRRIFLKQRQEFFEFFDRRQQSIGVGKQQNLDQGIVRSIVRMIQNKLSIPQSHSLFSDYQRKQNKIVELKNQQLQLIQQLNNKSFQSILPNQQSQINFNEFSQILKEQILLLKGQNNSLQEFHKKNCEQYNSMVNKLFEIVSDYQKIFLLFQPDYVQTIDNRNQDQKIQLDIKHICQMKQKIKFQVEHAIKIIKQMYDEAAQQKIITQNSRKSYQQVWSLLKNEIKNIRQFKSKSMQILSKDKEIIDREKQMKSNTEKQKSNEILKQKRKQQVDTLLKQVQAQNKTMEMLNIDLDEFSTKNRNLQQNLKLYRKQKENLMKCLESTIGKLNKMSEQKQEKSINQYNQNDLMRKLQQSADEMINRIKQVESYKNSRYERIKISSVLNIFIQNKESIPQQKARITGIINTVSQNEIAQKKKLKSQIQKLQSQKSSLNQSIQSRTKTKNRLQKEIDQMREKREKLQQEIKQMRESKKSHNNQSKSEQLTQTNQELKLLLTESQLKIETYEKQISELKKQIQIYAQNLSKELNKKQTTGQIAETKAKNLQSEGQKINQHPQKLDPQEQNKHLAKQQTQNPINMEHLEPNDSNTQSCQKIDHSNPPDQHGQSISSSSDGLKIIAASGENDEYRQQHAQSDGKNDEKIRTDNQSQAFEGSKITTQTLNQSKQQAELQKNLDNSKRDEVFQLQKNKKYKQRELACNNQVVQKQQKTGWDSQNKDNKISQQISVLKQKILQGEKQLKQLQESLKTTNQKRELTQQNLKNNQDINRSLLSEIQSLKAENEKIIQSKKQKEKLIIEKQTIKKQIQQLRQKSEKHRNQINKKEEIEKDKKIIQRRNKLNKQICEKLQQLKKYQQRKIEAQKNLLNLQQKHQAQKQENKELTQMLKRSDELKQNLKKTQQSMILQSKNNGKIKLQLQQRSQKLKQTSQKLKQASIEFEKKINDTKVLEKKLQKVEDQIRKQESRKKQLQENVTKISQKLQSLKQEEQKIDGLRQQLVQKADSVKKSIADRQQILKRISNQLTMKQQEKLKYFGFPNRCFVGDVITQEQHRQYIISELLLKYPDKNIAQTKLLYCYPKMKDLNFHFYINQINCYILLIRLIKKDQEGKNYIIACYSQMPLKQNTVNKGEGFISAVNKKQTFFLKTSNNSNPRITEYNPYYIVFGNSELMIKIDSPVLQTNIGHNFCSYETEEHKDASVFTGQKTENVLLECYEVYQLIFKSNR